MRFICLLEKMTLKKNFWDCCKDKLIADMSIENFRIKYFHKSVKQEEKSNIISKIMKKKWKWLNTGLWQGKTNEFKEIVPIYVHSLNTDRILKMRTNCTDPVQKLNHIIKTNTCWILVHLIVCMINIHHNSLFQSMQEI